MPTRKRLKEIAVGAAGKMATALFFTSASAAGSLIASEWTKPAEEKAIARVRAAWLQMLPAPDLVNAQFVLYKYKANYSSRCRTDAALFPLGTYPGAGACEAIAQNREQIRQRHMRGVCADLTREKLTKGSQMQQAWGNAEINASASCPVEVSGKPWGYAAINFQSLKAVEVNGVIKPGQRESLKTSLPSDRIYVVQKFRDAAEFELNRRTW